LEGVDNPWIVEILSEQPNTLIKKNIQLEEAILSVPTIKGAKAVVGLRTP
jgi:hypothetical protein